MAKKEKRPKKYLFEEVLNALRSKQGNPLNYKQIASLLGVENEIDRSAILAILTDLESKGLAEQPERGKYALKYSQQVVIGTIDFTQSGAAFLISEDKETDIFINPRNTSSALHGDTVKVKVFPRKRSDGKEEGEVIEIITRGRMEYVGVISLHGKNAFIKPDNPRLPEFFIPKDAIGTAKTGEKVVFRLTEWDEFSEQPSGEVVSVLGLPGSHTAEMNAIMIEYGLPPVFPKNVEEAASAINITITEHEIAKRRDFRDITTFTIDPVDAKDFDDALSVNKLENGNWEIGVHIADVSHYVLPDSILDKEALNRATSVYLVDRVVPMLPEVLSNYVCSLRPKEDKLCFSAVFELNDRAEIIREWFGRTIIHSDRRFTYEQVQEILEGAEGDFSEELHLLNKLAKKLREKRFANGAITFDKEEVKFRLDDKGNPVDVFFKVMKDSNQLIEDFMLLANRRVAEYVALSRKAGEPVKPQHRDLRRPYVYRVHNSPDPSRVEEFSAFVKGFGYRMDVGNDKAIAASLNKLLQDVKGKPEANLIETLAVRTMAKAYYTTKNIGHYGLGFEYYTHFTSPIRRYPDVMAHRLLQVYIDADAGNKPATVPSETALESQCKHSSEREKTAAEAERASIKFKQVQFLEKRVGELFEGIISGVAEYGFFVELIGNKCEGLVHMRSLNDDYYVFEDRHHRICGQRTGRIFQLGDRVLVRLKNADIIKKQLDFVVEEMVEKSPSRFDNSKGGGKNRGSKHSGSMKKEKHSFKSKKRRR